MLDLLILLSVEIVKPISRTMNLIMHDQRKAYYFVELIHVKEASVQSHQSPCCFLGQDTLPLNV